MDSNNITPGLIEGYCLGLLNPEESRLVEEHAQLNAGVRKEIDDFMQSFEAQLMANAVDPGEEVRAKTLSLLQNLSLEESQNPATLPLINRYSNHSNWLKIVEPILPLQTPHRIFAHELRNDGKVSQILMYAAVDYPDEVHTDEEECFIVLKGRCRCYIEDQVIELTAGDYLAIPMHKHHNVQVLEPVVAVVQRIKVA